MKTTIYPRPGAMGFSVGTDYGTITLDPALVRDVQEKVRDTLGINISDGAGGPGPAAADAWQGIPRSWLWAGGAAAAAVVVLLMLPKRRR